MLKKKKTNRNVAIHFRGPVSPATCVASAYIYEKKIVGHLRDIRKKKSPAELIAYRADRVPIEMHSYHPLLSPEDKTSKCALKKKAEEEREMNAISK